MNYSQKLKDPRWQMFRQDYIAFRRQEGEPDQCEDCGIETRGALHVHHRVYHSGREPWDYEYGDLRLLCEGCHESIHRTEDAARELIRSLPAHIMPEMQMVLDELALCRSEGHQKIALARAKNAIRNMHISFLTEESE